MRRLAGDRVRFGYECPPYPWSVISELAVYAERLGFDSFWMPDHTVGFSIRRWDALEAWSVLSALATLTRSITLGTAVSDTYRHHPAALAQMVATCDIISQGRAVLGVGLGEAMNLDPYGIEWSKPVERTREALHIITALWTEDEVTYAGTYYRLRRAFLQPKPVQAPHPPLYVAANSPRTMEMAARFGDGWLPASMQPDEYREGLRHVLELASGFGRFWDGVGGENPPEIDPALFLYVVVSASTDAARELVMLPAKMYLLSRPRIIERLGYPVPSRDFDMSAKLVFNTEVGAALLAKARELPDELVERSPVVFGSPDVVIGKLERYVQAGVRHFVTSFFVSPRLMKDTCRLYAEKVVGYLRDRFK